jgi:8-oxo-dGTP pyrophosphatase MutT (NUDIX family)
VTRNHPFTDTNRELLLDLGFLEVTKRSIEAPDGSAFKRIVIEHPGAVAVVPMITDDVILIRQYRAAAGQRLLEIPAGKLDLVGESVEDAARRELAEETGYIAEDFVHLTDLWTAVGFCDERISIFLASDMEVGTRHPIGPEEIDAEVVRMPFGDALKLVMSGDIADAKTVAGLLMTEQLRASS